MVRPGGWLAFGAWLLAVLAGGPAWPADAAAASGDAGTAGGAAAGPRAVVAGIYVNQVRSVSLKDNQFVADFYLWFRWRGDDIAPHETFELVNGDAAKVDEDPEVRQLASGENYVFVHVIGTITQFWDVARFPLDNHDLRIAIEDGEHEEHVLRYVPDTENSGLSPQVTLPGWAVRLHRVEAVRQEYATNYGFSDLPSGNKSRYSRLVFTLPAVRPGYGYFIKLFTGLFVATGIALLVFFIKPTDVDPRFGLGAGAIFAAIASEYVVTSSLPDTNILTMADSLHIVGFVTIFITIAESVYSLYLYTREEEDAVARSKRLDRAAFFVLAPGYVLVNVLIVAFC